MAQEITVPDPAIILDHLEAFRRSKTLFAAVSLGVFDALVTGPKTLEELSSQLQANAGGLERLLDACVCLQLLKHQSSRYENTDAATAYLTSDSPLRLTGYLNYSNTVGWNLWGHLEDAVREGTSRWQQAYGWDGPIFSNFFKTEDAKREFLMGMHGFGLISSPKVVGAFDLSRFTCLVDLGGATGHLAIAACQRYPNLRGIVFDLPDARPLAEEIIMSSGMSARIDIQSGDFFTDSLPRGDIYALGRIIHDWPEDKIQKLLGHVVEQLPPGGALLIAEKLLSNDKSGPRWAHMQNLNMLTCTEGKERTLDDYELLLKQAGFKSVVGCRTPSPLDVILATK